MNDQVISSELTEALAAIRGDRAAMSSLWRRHRRWVAAVLLAYKPRREDLDDLLQEVAMTVVTSIHTVRDPRHVRAWLRTVAINAARSAGRSKRPVAAGANEDCFDAESSTPFTSRSLADESDEEVQRMLNLATQLPERYREPLMLRAVRELSSRQVGDILDLPPATVDTRVCRARRMLRELAERQQWDDDGPDPFRTGDSVTTERHPENPDPARIGALGDER